MNSSEIERLVGALTDEELVNLNQNWMLWARPEQLPPKGNWSTWLLMGGRGSGKTRAGAEWVHDLATEIADLAPIALVGESLQEARSVMVEGASGLIATSRATNPARFESSRNLVRWENGATACLMSASSPEMFRGPQFAAAWCDELAKWPNAQHAWDMLQFGLRLGARPRQLVTTTPRSTPLLRQLIEDKRTVTVTMPTKDNRANLAPDFLEKIVGKYAGTLLGRQELDGELITEREGALWNPELIANAQSNQFGEPERIVVAVDPAVTARAKSDACGIVVAGKSGNCATVLADKTCHRLRPVAWIARVAALFHAHQADVVIVETNQGGDLVADLMSQLDDAIPVRSVTARRGKWLRAEPVAALYEQNRIAHVAGLNALEDELLNFEPTGTQTRSRGKSPDRVDALVWALTELLLTSHTPRVRRA